ncbi:O-antigen ligase family protein [Sphingobacterium griseoflavum]|nr:O-antigen ligase family protein [Sphingobacterium griseoflavum]
MEKLKLILILIFLLYSVQIIYTFLHILFFHNDNYRVSLRNTGAYAIYITILIPLWNHLKKEHICRWYLKPLITLYICIVVFSVLILKSRTALIALTLTYCLPYVTRFFTIQTYIKKVILFTALICIGFFISYYIFNLKVGSSFGRLLMIKIVLSNATEHFFWGVGLGNFTWYYPQWQSDFFRDTIIKDSGFFLNAGETYVLFNEILQLFVTLGVIPFVIFIILLNHYFTKIKKIDSDILNEIKKSFFMILICSLTYYTLHINAVLLVIVYMISLSDRMIMNHHGSRAGKRCSNYLKISIFSISLFTFFSIYPKYNAIKQWRSIKEASYSHIEGINIVDTNKVYTKLKNDGKFLADYANYLYEMQSDRGKAIELMEDSKKKFISKASIENLAYLYLEQGDYSKSIQYFEWLVGYIPSRFGYRLELIRLYEKVRNIEKAKEIADFTLNMPVKIESSEVFSIKHEISEIRQRLGSVR